jgi:O-acetyl-ADP-ribose deacetylase (regulator of RNase III)
LPARHVVHAVGPRWSGGDRGEPALLASAYRRSLQLAAEAGAASVAFPSISTGIYGYPVESAAPLALSTIRDELTAGVSSVRRVLFVLYAADSLQAFERAAAAVLGERQPGASASSR